MLSFITKRPRLTLIATCAMLASTSTVFAQEITLRSADGTLDIRGEFVSFDENTYTIRTDLGDLNISASLVRCEGAACPNIGANSVSLTMTGSDTISVGLMPLLLEGYAQSQDAAVTVSATANNGEIIGEFVADDGFGDEIASILVSSSSSSEAFAALKENTAEIGLSARRIQPDEARAVRDVGGGNMVSPQQEHIVAVDGLVVITHPDNPVNSLTTDELAAIYANRITNWSQVGGPDRAITVIHRRWGSGTREIFIDRVFEGDEPYVPWVTLANDNNQMAALVNANASAIGYVGYAFQRGAQAVTLVNECGLSMTPSAFAARTEEYALQRRLYLYSRGDVVNEDAASFISYATSSAADEVIEKAGFIGLGIDRQPMRITDDRTRQLQGQQVDAYETRLANDLANRMVNYDRLSATFRFQTGSSRLDERGRLDLQRLVGYLANAEHGTEVLVAGFTDSVGTFDSNLLLAKNRAQQVLAEIQAAGGDRLDDLVLDSDGFGELSPAACNVSDAGRRINRRVEIWLRSPA